MVRIKKVTYFEWNLIVQKRAEAKGSFSSEIPHMIVVSSPCEESKSGSFTYTGEIPVRLHLPFLLWSYGHWEKVSPRLIHDIDEGSHRRLKKEYKQRTPY